MSMIVQFKMSKLATAGSQLENLNHFMDPVAKLVEEEKDPNIKWVRNIDLQDFLPSFEANSYFQISQKFLIS